MNEKSYKACLISFNVIVMMAGMLMFVGGLVLEYTSVTSSILMTLHSSVTSSQIGAVGVALIAIGALIVLICFVGCCGAIYESRGLLFIYFLILLLLFLCQLGIGIASIVFGTGTFSDVIFDRLERYVNGYEGSNTEAENAIVDTVQQFFDCCGYNGTEDYRDYVPSRAIPSPTPPTTTMLETTPSNQTNVTLVQTIMPTQPITTSDFTTTSSNTSEEFFTWYWPESCCKDGADLSTCLNNSLPVSTLIDHLNTEGCTMSIEAWVQENLFIIGGVALGIAAIELISMIVACSLRNALD